LVEFAVVLAVGSPLHQSQLIYNRPRAMLPVLGKPMVVRTMERLFRAGISNYVVVVGEEEGAVAAYLNSQWLPNVQVEFVIQSINSNLTRTLTDIAHHFQKPFLVSAYNSFTHSNFPERLLNYSRDFEDDLILTGAPNTLSKSIPYAWATINGQAVADITQKKPTTENPVLALTNLAICGNNFIDYLSDLILSTGTLHKQLLDIFQLYVQTRKQALISETAWLLQVEADYDLLTLNRQLLDDSADTHILSELPTSVQVIPPVRIDPHVSVGQGARLGPRVYLEAGCSVGHHTTLTNAMIMQNAIIPAGSSINDAIVSTRTRIENPDKR